MGLRNCKMQIALNIFADAFVPCTFEVDELQIWVTTPIEFLSRLVTGSDG